MLVLASGERHGYEITMQVLKITNGEVKLGSGTLYRQLRQMVANGWIVEKEHPDCDDARRRYYALTIRGRRMAGAEARRLQELVRFARGRRLLPAAR